MPKLPDAVKALINASHAKPGYTPASAEVKPALVSFARGANDRKVGMPAWVTISTAVSATLNCPEAMTTILAVSHDESARSDSSSNSSSSSSSRLAEIAELIREVGLKCISFNGIPRTINCLGAFHASLPDRVAAALSKTPAAREVTVGNLEERKRDGRALWGSVYRGVDSKLIDTLARSHPDLPVHILYSHYANLLSDPRDKASGAKVGRVLTSLVAVACLRAQTGVGPQVVSHVFGLRKAYDNGEAHAEGEEPVEGGDWLASDDGNIWLLENVDKLVNVIGGGRGTSFAPGFKAKL